MKIVIALLVFSAIILFHELGHFLLAKWNKIVVTEFSLGMGPRLFSFEKGGTRYSLKLLPFGGSCMMLGEDEDMQTEGSFASKSVWARISVVAAGPVFNFILAYVLSLFILGSIGYDIPVLLGISDGSPAQEAGLLAGDRITSLNGHRVHFYREILDYATFHEGEPATFGYSRQQEDGTVISGSVYVAPALGNSGYKFGISGSTNYRERTGILGTIRYSAYEVGYWISVTLQSLRMLVTGKVSVEEVSGPVGVVDVIGDTYEESKSSGVFYIWLNIFNISILLSANLGVMNLLPIPALDGGRLVFLLIEAVRRKRLNPELEGRVHLVGLMALMVLMVLVLFSDIRKLIG